MSRYLDALKYSESGKVTTLQNLQNPVDVFCKPPDEEPTKPTKLEKVGFVGFVGRSSGGFEINQAEEVGTADTVKSRCWWIHFADRDPVECWSSPPASLAEILENRPDAIAAEPFEPGAAKYPPAHHGGEGVDAPKPDPFPDDRRYCTACRNLRGAVCSIARPEAGAVVIGNRGYRPDLARLVRCAGFIEVAP